MNDNNQEVCVYMVIWFASTLGAIALQIPQIYVASVISTAVVTIYFATRR